MILASKMEIQMITPPPAINVMRCGEIMQRGGEHRRASLKRQINIKELTHFFTGRTHALPDLAHKCIQISC